MSRRRLGERERERAFIREGNRAPVSKATHSPENGQEPCDIRTWTSSFCSVLRRRSTNIAGGIRLQVCGTPPCLRSSCDRLHVYSNKHHHHPRPDASTGNCLGWMYSSRPLKERAVFGSAVLVPRYISAPIPLGLALCFSRQRKRLLTPFHIVNIGRPLQSPRALPLTCPTLSHGRLGIREGPATDAAKARA